MSKTKRKKKTTPASAGSTCSAARSLWLSAKEGSLDDLRYIQHLEHELRVANEALDELRSRMPPNDYQSGKALTAARTELSSTEPRE